MAAITADGRQELVALYLTMFGRGPTILQLARMVVARENGSTPVEVAATLSTETEFALVASQDANGFAVYVADALLSVDILPAARAWAIAWLTTQVQGAKTKAQVIVEAVQALRATTNVNYALSRADLAADVSRILDGVDYIADPASIVLTIGIDTLVGTSSNDNYVASLNASDASKTTLNSADNINGNTGTDTLTIAASGTGTTTVSGVTLTAVENLSITNGATAAHTFDASLSSGITRIAVSGSTAAVSVNNLKAIPSVTLNSNASDVTIGVQVAVNIGLADAASVTLNASNTANSGTLTFDGIETLNVNVTRATGSASTPTTAGNTLTLADSTLQTLNIAGTGGSWLAATLSGASGTTTGTVTSAGGADNVTLTAGGSAKLSVAMGAGNDGVSLGAVVATYTVDGGDGNDTLTYSGATAITSALAANVTGFEAVKLTNATPASFQMAIGNVTYTTAAAGTYTGLTAAIAGTTLNLEAGGTVTLAAAGGAVPANEYTGTADSVTVYVGRSNTTGNLTSSLSSSGVETVTVSNLSLGSDTTSTRTNSITDAKMKTLVVIGGSQATTISGGGAALTKVDASGVAGAVTLSATVAAAGAALIGGGGNDVLAGGAGADSLTGGAGNDSLSGGAGNDVLDGGDGADTLVGGEGQDSMTGGAGADTFIVAANTTLIASSTASSPKVVTDFTSGTDKLEFSQGVIGFLGNFTNIQQALATQNGGRANTAAFVQDENSLYVFTNTNGTLNVLDAVVKLPGITALATGDLLLGSQGSAGGATITLSSAGTTVSGLTAADDVVSATLAQLVGTTASAGFGADTLNITGTAGGTLSSANLSNITGFETITLADNTTAAYDITLNNANGGAGNTLVVNASSTLGLDSTGTLFATAVKIVGSNEADAQLSLTGGAGRDSLTGGALNDTLIGGAGNDVLQDASGGSDYLDGGEGNDLLEAGAAGAFGRNIMLGGAGNDTITASATSDSIDGGSGNDRLTVAAVTFTSSAVLDGGTGNGDRLIVGGATNFAAATLTGFEQLDFAGGNHQLTMTLAQHNSFTTGVGMGAANIHRITLTGPGAITGLSEDAGDDLSYVLANGTGNVFTAATTATDYRITGGDSATTYNFLDTLTAAETVTGTAGSDTLRITGGGSGSANITGIETVEVNYASAATFTTGSFAGADATTITAAGSTAAVTLVATNFSVGATSLTIIDGAGSDAITIPSSDANRGKTTVTLSTGGADQVTITNTAFNGTTSNAVTINNFTQGVGTNHDKVLGLGITTLWAVTATGTAVAAANAVIEIESAAGTATTFDAGDAGIVETMIDTALTTYGGADGSSFYALVYGSGANAGKAGLYQVNVTTAATGITAANIAVELVGIFNGTTADAFEAGSFI